MRRSFLILVGPTRTGTTTLFRVLARDNTRFVPSRKKETNHFLAAAGGDSAPGPSAYLAQFSPARSGEGRVYVEASPLYFALPHLVAPRIATALADHEVRVLVTLREPVDRFESLYHHAVTKRDGQANQDVAAFVARALDYAQLPLRERRCDPDRLAVTEGFYRELLSHWLDAFGHDHVRVMYLDDVRDRDRYPHAMRELGRWLGTDLGSASLEAPAAENPTQYVRWGGIHQAALRVNDAMEPLLNRMPMLRRLTRGAYYAVNRSAPPSSPLDARTRQALADLYRRRNAGLDELVEGISLAPRPGWVDDVS